MNTPRRTLFAFVCCAALTLALTAVASEPRGPFNQDPGSGTPGGTCSSSTGCHDCMSAQCVRVYNNGGCTCSVTIQYNIDGSSAQTCTTDGNTCTYR